MAINDDYPRDLVGYGRELPDPQWPNGARLAITLAINYEVGAELNILHGDSGSEGDLTDTFYEAAPGERVMIVESAYEFGSRRGIWRLFDIVGERNVKVSLQGVGMALERYPDVPRAFAAAGHEIVPHGYRWIDYRDVSEDQEREYIRRAIQAVEQLTGSRPTGWMTGRPSSSTRRLIVEEGLEYDRDALNDELPYWLEVAGRQHLVIPYSYELNDNRYGSSRGGFVTGEDFYVYMRETFDQLYEEGASQPKMMSVAVHERISGRAGRARAVARFLDYALARDDVWFCTGQDISAHWRQVHPCEPGVAT